MYLVRFVWVGLLLTIRTNGLQAQLELPTTARRRTPVARPVPTLAKFLCQTKDACHAQHPNQILVLHQF